MMKSAMNEEHVFPVVIVGGGLAGLTAAVHLAARGIEPLVLEEDNEWPGGRLAGGDPDEFEHNGRKWSFSTSHGIHAVWGAYDNMRAMLDRFIDIQLRPSEGEAWINRWRDEVRIVEAGNAVRGGWIPAPLHYLQLLFRPRFWNTITLLDFLSLPGFLLSIFWTTGLDPIKEGVALDGLKMKEYFRGWTPNLRATFTGLGVNLLASNAEEINLTAFIAAIRFYTMLRRDFWQLDYLPGDSHKTLIVPLIEKIEQQGGKVQGGMRVRSLRREGDGWKLQVDDARLGGTRSIEAKQVILAVNPRAAQQILLESVDTAAVANTLKFPSVTRNATVRLWFDVAPRQGAAGGMFTGDFLIDNFFWLHRIHEDFFEWHHVTAGSAIEVHIYNRDAVLNQPDQIVIISVMNELHRVFPNLRGHLVHAALRRNGYTQTQFVVPTAKSLFVDTPWQNILACGDWIGYASPALWMERSIVTGIAAANRVLQANGADPFEIIAPRRPELLARLIGGSVYRLRKLFGPAILGLARLLRGKKV